MSDLSTDQVLSPITSIRNFVQEIHTAIENKDTQSLNKLALGGVFVLGAAAQDVSIGKNQCLANLRSYFEQSKDVEFHVQSSMPRVGLCDSRRSAWIADQFVVDIVVNGEITRSIPIRLTGLLVQDQDWRLSATYWSIPLRNNEYQHALLHDGKIQSGFPLDDQVAPKVHLIAQSLAKVMTNPISMSELYSVREDSITIGSTIDEVFLAADGKNWVREITELPLKFALRGGVRGGVSPDGCTAWIATHVDIVGGITMPYRFFYIWLREQDGWKIVVSHDAVSIDPFNSGFDFP